MKKIFVLTVSGLLFSYCLTAQTDTTINGVTYNLFAPGLWVESEASSFTCGDDVTFEYNGQEVTYGTVESSGRCWLDRNLGADPLPFDPDDATGNTDERLYGDLFQWGRGDDGHEKRDSPTYDAVLSTDGVANFDNNSANAWHGEFILRNSGANNWVDPSVSGVDDLWQGVNGTNNPCPTGFRLPTEAEWEAERESWITNNAAGAFDSPLKLPMAGFRHHSDGSLVNVGTGGYCWSSTVSGTDSRYLVFGSRDASINAINLFRADGNSVRCIKK